MASIQFHKQVQTIRIDNRTKFINKNCEFFFQEKSILHQRTSPYTPKQNGVAKKKHKKLLQVARPLMFQSNLPKYYSGESNLTATHIINLTPSRILNWKSPHEVLFAKIPDYDFLRVFGCLCHTTNVYSHKENFEPRAFKYIFIGYTPAFKAYKLFNIQTKKKFMSNDVVFHEYTFPYQRANIYIQTQLYFPYLSKNMNHQFFLILLFPLTDSHFELTSTHLSTHHLLPQNPLV